MNIVCNFKWLQYWKWWLFIADLKYETVIPKTTKYSGTRL